MIYFDNSATTYPKPAQVIRGTHDALVNYSFNSGRGGYRKSLIVADKIYNVREKIADMFGTYPEKIVFTKNCTEALNMAIKGSVKKGEHIIISSLEHNSVSRVAEKLENNGIIEYDIADYSQNDEDTVRSFESLIRENTTLIVCTHSSNAFGVCLPISKLGKLCRRRGVRFIVDAAQGAGVADINMKRDNIDILCAAGHKSLLGPMGTGFMAIGNAVVLDTIVEGGTGSRSLSLSQPDFLPDRFESGTLNNCGIIGLGHGIDYINMRGRENIYEHEMALAKMLYGELAGIESVKLYTPPPEKYKSMPIVSFNYKDYSSERVAAMLNDYDICTRAGYHCAVLAHRHFRTLDVGAVRLSLGCFNSEKECFRFINVVKKL